MWIPLKTWSWRQVSSTSYRFRALGNPLDGRRKDGTRVGLRRKAGPDEGKFIGKKVRVVGHAAVTQGATKVKEGALPEDSQHTPRLEDPFPIDLSTSRTCHLRLRE